jgi:hypothetical protein
MRMAYYILVDPSIVLIIYVNCTNSYVNCNSFNVYRLQLNTYEFTKKIKQKPSLTINVFPFCF